jgi:hypothetical protein
MRGRQELSAGPPDIVGKSTRTDMNATGVQTQIYRAGKVTRHDAAPSSHDTRSDFSCHAYHYRLARLALFRVGVMSVGPSNCHTPRGRDRFRLIPWHFAVARAAESGPGPLNCSLDCRPSGTAR